MPRIIENYAKQLSPRIVITYLTNRWGANGVRRYTKNTVWMFAGQAMTLLSFAVNVIVARTLGPESFGLLNYILAFAGIFGFIAQAGLNEVLPRDLVQHKEKQRELIGGSVLILGTASIIAWLSTIIAVLLHQGDGEIKLLIIMYATAYFWLPINTIISSFFIAQVQSKKIALTQGFVLILVSTFRLAILFFTKDLFLFIATFVIEPALTAIGYYYQSRKTEIWRTALRLDRDVLRSLLTAGIFLMCSSGLSYLLLRVDQVMMRTLLDETSVGYYAVAVRISELWYFIPGLICASLLPALVNATETSPAEYKNRMRHLYILLFTIAIIIAIATTLLAPWIIRFMYGSAYIPAIPILTVYAWSNVGFFLLVGTNKQLLVEQSYRSIVLYGSIAVILNIGLNLILMPSMGSVGAAWSTLISYTIIPILHFLRNYRHSHR